MKLELNFYKPSGKWYTAEIINDIDVDLVEYHIKKYLPYDNMDYTVHIVAPDGVLQPYRMFKR